MVEVSKRAREEAADYWRDFVAKVGECIVENSIRRGDMDEMESVQRFARLEADTKTETAMLREALEKANSEITVLKERLSNSIGFAGGKSPIAHQPGGSASSAALTGSKS